MLFYTSTFLAILIALLAIRLIYKAVFSSCDVISDASQRVCSTNERYSIAANASGHLNCGVGSSAVTGPLTTPGLNTHVTAWNLAAVKPVEGNVKHDNDNVWPLCETMGAPLGKSSKVRRYENGPKIQTLDMVSKPFRREASPDTLAPDTTANPSSDRENPEIPSLENINKLIMQKEKPVKSGTKTEGKPWGW